MTPPRRLPGFILGLSLPEPDTDTINCDQFSKLLQDMEGDEETREAYANIGKKVVEAGEGHVRQQKIPPTKIIARDSS